MWHKKPLLYIYTIDIDFKFKSNIILNDINK